MSVRVRFAPSPTGHLHIGGARTALFNWLFARKMKGAFILRIEDTDEVRSTEDSVSGILNSMTWLGLDWDEGPSIDGAEKGKHAPYYQMARAAQGMYQKCADQLIQEGKAFRCYATPEEVDEQKRIALLNKQPPKFRSPYRDLSPEQLKARGVEGKPFTVRFKTPTSGVTRFTDLVRGPMEFENDLTEDFILVKTGGGPTYNFACVVDDHFMEISHVIRGDDHLSNTPRQVLVYQALGWTPPYFAHLSMILGSDGTRLSKRHGASSALEFRDQGYLADALLNYLALLGWATEDSQDLFKPEELIQKFSLERCGKSPATFDPAKLLWMNGEYVRARSVAQLIEEAKPFLEAAGLGNADASRLEQAVHLEHEKIKRLSEIPDLIGFLLRDSFDYDAASVEKTLRVETAPRVLEEMLKRLPGITPFDASGTEAASKQCAKDLGLKNAVVYHPLRVAVSGRTQGPSLFHMLEFLGKERSLARLQSTLNKLTSNAL